MSLNPFPNALFSFTSCSYAILVLEMLPTAVLIEIEGSSVALGF
jgi:hypothetical protein